MNKLLEKVGILKNEGYGFEVYVKEEPRLRCRSKRIGFFKWQDTIYLEGKLSLVVLKRVGKKIYTIGMDFSDALIETLSLDELLVIKHDYLKRLERQIIKDRGGK